MTRGDTTVVVDECSAAGSDILVLSHRFRPRSGLFLNLGDTAKCSGLVTSLNYCYGVADCENGSSLLTKFMLYRPDVNRSNELVVLPESVRLISVKCENTASRVKCGEEVLPTTEQFSIQENDIIAICLPQNKRKLRLISRKYENDDDDQVINTEVFQYENADCDSDKLIHINREDLSSRSHLQLHLSAEISITVDDETSPTAYKQSEDNTSLLLKTIPGPIVGTIAVLAVSILVVTCFLTWKRLKERQQTLRNSPSNQTADNRDQVYSVPIRSRTVLTNGYNIKSNIAYNLSAERYSSSNRDTGGYEIV